MKPTQKVIISKFGRQPVLNRPTTLNADNVPKAVVSRVNNPLARKQ
jgi:hypothetical protein